MIGKMGGSCIDHKQRKAHANYHCFHDLGQISNPSILNETRRKRCCWCNEERNYLVITDGNDTLRSGQIGYNFAGSVEHGLFNPEIKTK
jgi:hypothetical protein